MSHKFEMEIIIKVIFGPGLAYENAQRRFQLEDLSSHKIKKKIFSQAKHVFLLVWHKAQSSSHQTVALGRVVWCSLNNYRHQILI